jgi:hypothetical protein
MWYLFAYMIQFCVLLNIIMVSSTRNQCLKVCDTYRNDTIPDAKKVGAPTLVATESTTTEAREVTALKACEKLLL